MSRLRIMQAAGWKLDQKCIIFDNVACCAFEHCGIDPDASPMRENVEGLLKAFGPDAYLKPFSQYIKYFERTPETAFRMANQFVREFYTLIGVSEIERLKTLPDPLLTCGHLTTEHIEAVEGVVMQITAEDQLVS